MQEISRYYPSDCSSVKMTQLKNMLYKVTLFEFNRFVTLPSITVDDERRLMKLSAVTVDILDKAKLKEYFAVYSTLPTKFSS